MNKLIFIVLLQLGVAGKLLAQANDNCANATTLVSGAAAICSQSTSGGGIQAGEVISTVSTGASSAFTRTIWYSFQATSTSMFVELRMTGLPSCPSRLSVIVYNVNTCIPSAANIHTTQVYNGDGAMVMTAAGLTIGNYYKVQVGYSTGGGCTFNPTFCIRVGDTPPASSCAAPSTTGCGYSSLPLLATILGTCPAYQLTPLNDGGTTTTYYYNFVATSTVISFSMIINSTCTAGNVTGLTWTLQRSSCGANVASGTLASMSASGLIVGMEYVLGYTYTIPTTCYHSLLYPYFVGASALPMELTSFSGRALKTGNLLTWETKTENGNDYFTVERSLDGENWAPVALIGGSGTTMAPTQYEVLDTHRENAIQYYRLSQTDFNGSVEVFEDKIIAVDNREAGDILTVKYIDLNGREVQEGEDVSGIYLKKTEYVDGKIEVVKIFR